MKRIPREDLIEGFKHDFRSPMSERLRTVETNDTFDGTRVKINKAITLDIFKSRVLDDAIKVNKLADGRFKVVYSIVDVGAYISDIDLIFQELLYRFSSIYYSDSNGQNGVHPLFPQRFTNQIGFFENPTSYKKSVSFEFLFSESGEIESIAPIDVYLSNVQIQRNFNLDSLSSYLASHEHSSVYCLPDWVQFYRARVQNSSNINKFQRDLFTEIKLHISRFLEANNYLAMSVQPGDQKGVFFAPKGGITTLSELDLSTDIREIASKTRLFIGQAAKSDAEVSVSVNAPMRNVTDLFNLYVLAYEVRTGRNTVRPAYLDELSAFSNEQNIRGLTDFRKKELSPTGEIRLPKGVSKSTINVKTLISNMKLNEIIEVFSKAESVYVYLCSLYAKELSDEDLNKRLRAHVVHDWDFVFRFLDRSDKDKCMKLLRSFNKVENSEYFREVLDEIYRLLTFIFSNLPRFDDKAASKLRTRYMNLKKVRDSF